MTLKSLEMLHINFSCVPGVMAAVRWVCGVDGGDRRLHPAPGGRHPARSDRQVQHGVESHNLHRERPTTEGGDQGSDPVQIHRPRPQRELG